MRAPTIAMHRDGHNWVATQQGPRFISAANTARATSGILRITFSSATPCRCTGARVAHHADPTSTALPGRRALEAVLPEEQECGE